MYRLGVEKKSLKENLEFFLMYSEEINLLGIKNNSNHLKTKTGRVVNESTTFHLVPKKPLKRLGDLNKFLDSKINEEFTNAKPIFNQPFSIKNDRAVLGNLVYEEVYKNYPTSNISTVIVFPSIEVYNNADIKDAIINGISLEELKNLTPKSKFENFLDSFLSVYYH